MIVSANRHRWLIVALAALILGSALGQRLPWHIDEVRFVGVALEMLQSGQWWVPHRAGEIYADKPPIFFWTMAAAIKLIGSVRWAFPLPALLASGAALLLIYDLGSRLWNRRVGLCAAVLLLCCYQFWRLATYAHIDGFLVGWTTLGLYGFTRHLLSGRDQRWFYLAFAALAVGILSKGVGFLPVLIALPYAAARWRGATLAAVPARQWLFGVAILLGLLLCWLVPLLIFARSDAEIQAYLHEILFRQTAKRYTDAWQHREPVWFFLAQIPKYWAPLSLLLPWLVPIWWQRLRRNDSRYVLLLGWAALVLLFFSLSSGKRELYMLPALPAVALAAAAPLQLLLRKRWMQRFIISMSVFLIVVAFAVGAIRIGGVLPKSSLMQWPVAAGYALFAGGVLALLGMVLLRRRHAAVRWLAVYVILIACYQRGLLPLADAVESGQPAMAALSQAAAPAALALIDWDEREWLYSEAPLLHNGIRSANDTDLCSTAAVPMQWVLNTETAARLHLPIEPAFAIQPHDVYVVLTPQQSGVPCTTHTPFRYRFEWNAASRQRLAR
jgi:4-amino-4-deoxy-L-arabinose transferase-like glycosyltransferase